MPLVFYIKINYFINRGVTMPSRKKVTLKDIAAMAGCSVGVISSVLNHSRSNIVVSAATRNKVEELAASLGYQANYHAQVLHSRRSMTVGLLLNTPDHLGFWSEFVCGVDQEVRKGECDLLIIGPSPRLTEVERGVKYLQQLRIDALIMPGFIYKHILPELDKKEETILVVFSNNADITLPRIEIDPSTGQKETIEYLYGLGHRELLWVGIRNGDKVSNPERTENFRNLIAEYGMKMQEYYVDVPKRAHDFSEVIEKVRTDMKKMIPTFNPFTAVLAYNETTAFGIQTALKSHGMSVPEDVSLICFDDIFSELNQPPLTAISLNLRQLGSRAAQLAMEMADNRGKASYRNLIEWNKTSLNVRKSTAVVKREG
jgi:LacI family transcriptional regulator